MADPSPPPGPTAAPAPGSWLGPLLLLLVVPAALLLQGSFGQRVLFPVHTDQFSPWRAEVSPERLAALEASSLTLATDGPLMFHPQVLRVQQRWAADQEPLWDPFQLGGVPLLAQAVHGALNPLNAPLRWWPGARGYAAVAALQCLLAALGAYLLARHLGCARAAACLAALGFSLCGFLAVRWHWFQIQGASISLPFLLLGTDRLCTLARARSGSMALIATALGLSFLAGFPPSTILGLYAAAAWATVRLLRSDFPWRARVFAGLRLSLAVLVGLALGLPQFLPAASWATSGESDRAAVEPAIVRSLAMNPASLLRLPMPLLFGHPTELAEHELSQLRAKGTLSRLLQKDNANHVETASSIGVTALLLAVLGLATRRGGRFLLAGLFFGGALLSLDTPLVLPVLHLPGLDTSDPRRFQLLLGLGGALLGAFGLQRLLEGKTPRWFLAFAAAGLALTTGLALAVSLISPDTWLDVVAPRLATAMKISEDAVRVHAVDLELDLQLLKGVVWRLAVVTAASLIGILAIDRRPRLGATWLLLVALADLGSTARLDAAFVPAEGLFRDPPALAALQGDGSGRLIRFHPGAPSPLEYPLPPNTGMPFGIRDASGYITLAPWRWQQLHEWLQPGTRFGVGTAALSDLAALDSPILDRMAVDRVLSSVEIDRSGMTPLGRVGDAWLYRNEGARPRFSLAGPVMRVSPGVSNLLSNYLGGVPVYPGGSTSSNLHGEPLTGPLRHELVFIEDPELESQDEDSVWSRPLEGSDFESLPLPTVLRDEPEYQAVEVDSAEDTWLIVADSWTPGWTASVDGEAAPLYPADLALRAVPVPAGKHTVELRYAAPGAEAGRLAGWIGLALVVLWLLKAAWPRHEEPAAPV